jgi:hypothetical protein
MLVRGAEPPFLLGAVVELGGRFVGLQPHREQLVAAAAPGQQGAGLRRRQRPWPQSPHRPRSVDGEVERQRAELQRVP